VSTPSDEATSSVGPPLVVVETDPAAATRSPSDVLRLAVAGGLVLGLLLVQWLFGDALVDFFAQLLRGLDAVPEWLATVLVVTTRVLAAVLLVAGLVAVLRRGRWRVLLTVGSAAVASAAISALLERWGPSAAAVLQLSDDAGPLTSSSFPSVAAVGAASAAVTAAAPWLPRRWRRLGWTLVVALSFCRFLTAPVAFDTVGAMIVGWLIGALAVVVFGGPSRRPLGRAIGAGLAAVGQPLTRLEQASLDARGSTPYFGVSVDGNRLFIKALGEDQRSADVLFRFYRKLLPRDLGDEKPFSTLRRAVEHEALVALTARELGVCTPRLVALATAEPNAFVLAYEAVDGRSLDRVEPADVTDALLVSIWAQVTELRTHRIAHRDLRLANVFVASDGRAWMIDFGFGELAASDLLLANDVAEFLASSSFLVGPERAVVACRTGVGLEGLASALDRLHPWALSGATRSELKARPGWLDDLRARVAATAD
jgi:undecaprenyl-diphosphatase